MSMPYIFGLANEIEIEGERMITRGIYHKEINSFFSPCFYGIWNRRNPASSKEDFLELVAKT